MKKLLALALLTALVLSASPGREAQSQTASIDRPLVIQDWLVAGPFSRGTREGDILDLIDRPERRSINPVEGLEQVSILAPGGIVRWVKVTGDDQGKVKFTFPGIDLKTIEESFGSAGSATASYAFAALESPGPRRALIVADRVDTFWLNNQSWPGDVYGTGTLRVPILLRPGRNEVLLKLTRGDEFTFKVVPAEAPLVILSADATVPDAVEGLTLKQWLGITIVNTTEQTLNNITLRTGDGQDFLKKETQVRSLAPLSLRKIPVPLESGPAPRPKGKDQTVAVPVLASVGGSTQSGLINLRFRTKGQAYKTTFRSGIDGSVQYFAVLPPKDYDPRRTYALILSLHGAGVEASGQAEAYQPKDWAFVVCPTNRKPFGFDWQDWGRLDCLEVLAEAKARFPIDENRVYLTGHSMGGHGTWHVGLLHSDLFAAMAPSAGWTSFQLYVPFTLRRSDMLGQPGLLAIRDAALRPDRAENFVENALNLPVYILHGGADDNVPPVHARIFFSLLKRLGYPAEFREVPGQGHWWDDPKTEGIDCVDSRELMDFLKSRQRQPQPRHVHFRTADLGACSRRSWVEVNEPLWPFRDSVVEADVQERTIVVLAENIGRLTVHDSAKLLPAGNVDIRINGQTVGPLAPSREPIVLATKENRWQIENSAPGRPQTATLKKTSKLYGPIKQAYFSPFVFVYGTRGDAAATQTNLHWARVEAQNWWYRANGFVEIIPDGDVTPAVMGSRNLVLFGGPETNSVTAGLQKGMPLVVRNNRVVLAGREIGRDDVAYQVIYPNPRNPSKLVVIKGGTSVRAESKAGMFNLITSGAGLPDFIVYDEGVKDRGWAAVLAAGFFGLDWQYDSRLAFVEGWDR